MCVCLCVCVYVESSVCNGADKRKVKRKGGGKI